MNDVDLVEFDVSADKSSTESENEGFPLTLLPAERRPARRQQRIGVNRPAIVREIPHFCLFPAFPHFCENVPHFWLYFETTKIAENRNNVSCLETFCS